MVENEKLFRKANERLRGQVEDAVSQDDRIPFLCECVDELCLDRVEMTLGEYRDVRASSDTFAVVPGHAVSPGETVVEEHGDYHVVQKVMA